MFRSLRHPQYRLLVAGQVASSSGQWMEQVARGWLVYEMTDSALLLGAVSATRALPLLIFSLVGGVFADRYDRKRQLMLAQNANAVLNLVLAVLVLTGRVEAWHVFVTAFMAGSVMAFQQPARQAMIPSVVPREDLLNAAAINSGVINSSRSVGPAVAGVLVAVVGVGWSYVFQAALFFFASLWTAQITLPALPPRRARADGTHESVWQSFTSGVGYVRTRPMILGLLSLSIVPIILAQPYQSLAPVFARDVFNIGAAGQGLLLALPGIGSIAGALVVARLDSSKGRTRHLIGGLLAFGLGLIVFGVSPWLVVGLGALLVIGFASTSYRAVNMTLLQLHTEDAFRGRVMSMYLLDRGLAPAGALLAGLLATALGAPGAVVIMGALTIGFALVLFFGVPQIRGLSEAHVAPAHRADEAEATA